MANILIVDDEAEIIELIDFYMKQNGYQTYRAQNGIEALQVFEKQDIDLVILDVMMPGMDGKETLRRIKGLRDVPIIFLSAKGQDVDKIEGLFLGAEDYMAKPFNPMELVLRVKSQLKRGVAKAEITAEGTALKVGDLELDEIACRITLAGEPVEMTSYEYKLLAFFLKNRNQVFTKGQLYEQVWQESYMGDERIIMVYISKLREKIEEDPKEPRYIKTIRGLGYIFEDRP